MTEKESTAGMIGIFTPNPHDITTEEAEELAKLFRSACPDYEVQATGKEREGYGVTLFEVVRISITGGAVGTTSTARCSMNCEMDITNSYTELQN